MILDNSEKKIVYQCIVATCSTDFFPDWEFQTLFGIERSEYLNLKNDWHSVNLENDYTINLIKMSLGHLLGYPHGQDSSWHKWISASQDDLINIIKKI